jgi:hypothetical protein
MESPGHHVCGGRTSAWAVPAPSPKAARPRPPDTNSVVANPTIPRLRVWVFMLRFPCSSRIPRPTAKYAPGGRAGHQVFTLFRAGASGHHPRCYRSQHCAPSLRARLLLTDLRWSSRPSWPSPSPLAAYRFPYGTRNPRPGRRTTPNSADCPLRSHPSGTHEPPDTNAAARLRSTRVPCPSMYSMQLSVGSASYLTTLTTPVHNHLMSAASPARRAHPKEDDGANSSISNTAHCRERARHNLTIAD